MIVAETHSKEHVALIEAVRATRFFLLGDGWLDDEGETHTFGALEGKGLFTNWQPLPAPPKDDK